METTYTVGELKSLIREASSNQEFKPKLGPDVESKNKEINDKAYKDAEKISKEHYGKKLEAPEISKYEKHDWNKTTLDADFDFDPGKDWKEKQKAHVEGYTSKDEKDNGIEKTGDFEGNKDFYDASKEIDDTAKRNKEIMNSTGLKSNNIYNRPGGKDYFKREGGYVNEKRTPVKTIFESVKKEKVNESNDRKVKTVFFKKTTFLTEGHMISRIPDEFKNEGCTFKMKDKTGNEYLIEWSDNRANIIRHEDKKKVNECINRMMNLAKYDSGSYFKNSTSSERLNESNDGFTSTLDNARKITIK